MTAPVLSLRSNEPIRTLSIPMPPVSEKPKSEPPSWTGRLVLPFVGAVLIDGLSEALKAIGDNINSLIRYGQLMDSVDWSGAGMLVIVVIVLTVGLYFVLKKSAKYESKSLAVRTLALVVSLLLVGSSHLWSVLLERSVMHDMYKELKPGTVSLCDIDHKFPVGWNKRIEFHSDDPTDRCTKTCSFMFIYPVAELFGEGEMTFKFGADKRILEACWLEDCSSQ